MATKNLLKDELKKKDFRVSIFGSARIKKSSKDYKEAFNLAKGLGSRGIDVITGGGPGIMEAAASGHKKGRKNNNTHTIGLNIKLIKEQKPNKSLDIVKTFDRFSGRLDNFMSLSNAIVIFPGGVGTLLEFFYSWQLVQVKKICNIPIILIGDMWPGLIKWLEKEPLSREFFEEHDLQHLIFVKDYKEALKILDHAYGKYKKGGDKICLNVKKYKLII